MPHRRPYTMFAPPCPCTPPGPPPEPHTPRPRTTPWGAVSVADALRGISSHLAELDETLAGMPRVIAVNGAPLEPVEGVVALSLVDSAKLDGGYLRFKAGDAVLFSVDASPFVKDGMVDAVGVADGNLVVTFNTDSGKQPVSIPLADIFDADGYYDKAAADGLLANKVSRTGDIMTGPLELSNNTASVRLHPDKIQVVSSKSPAPVLKNYKFPAPRAGNGVLAVDGVLAPEFDEYTAYRPGDVVVHESVLFICNTAHTGAFDDSHFDDTTVASLYNGCVAQLAGKLSTSGGVMRGALKFYDPAVGPEEDMYEDWLSFHSSGDGFRFSLGVDSTNAAPLMKWGAGGYGERRAQFQDKSGMVAFLEDLPYSLVAPAPSGASLPAGVTVKDHGVNAVDFSDIEIVAMAAGDWYMKLPDIGVVTYWLPNGTFDYSVEGDEPTFHDSTDAEIAPPNLVLTYPLADRAVSKVSVASGVEVSFSFPEPNEGRSRDFYIRLRLGGDDTPINLPDDVDIEVLGGRMPDMSGAGTYIVHFRETDEDVFEMSSTGPVMTSPYDRTVDYVRSDGSQYIDTGIIGREGTTVTVDMAGLGNVKNMAMFGVVGDDGATYMAMRYNQNLRVIYGMSGGDGDGTVSPFTFGDDTRHVISCAVSANGTLAVDVDGTRKINAQNVGRLSSGSAMFLFAGNRSGVPSYTAIMKLYRCSIRQDGVLVRDYIPCVRNGRAGLYDTMSGKVSFSLSGTDFILPESEVDDL